MPPPRLCLAILIAAAATSPAFSANTTWNGGAGLWNSANWSAGVPDASTDARIDNNTAVNSTVTISTNAVAASLVLDLKDKLLLGSGAGVTLTTSSIGNAGTISTGALYASLSASGIFVNNGLIDITGGSTLFIDSQALVNNGLLSIDAPTGANAAHLVLNHSNTPNGLSYSGYGNISVGTLASLVIDNPLNSTATGWLDVNGSVQINAVSMLSFGALRGDVDASISSSSPGLSTLAVTNGSVSLAYDGTLSGNLSLTKSGANNLILTNDNSYAGTTDVRGGTLQLDNPTLSHGGAGAGALTVYTGGILAGEGSTASFTSIQSGGVVSPGDWGAGTFTAANSLQLLPNATLLFDISATPGSSDLLQITGGQFSATSVNVQFTPHGSLPVGKAWTLLTWNGASLAGAAITPATFHLVAGSAHGFFTVDTIADTLSFTETILGDANQDGRVDLTDFSTILNHFGKTSSLWTDGNFDGAATIDLTDLSYVLNNFGTIISPSVPTAATAAPAPEPASLFALAALLPAALRRPQKQKRTAFTVRF